MISSRSSSPLLSSSNFLNESCRSFSNSSSPTSIRRLIVFSALSCFISSMNSSASSAPLLSASNFLNLATTTSSVA